MYHYQIWNTKYKIEWKLLSDMQDRLQKHWMHNGIDIGCKIKDWMKSLLNMRSGEISTEYHYQI